MSQLFGCNTDFCQIHMLKFAHMQWRAEFVLVVNIALFMHK